MSEADDGPGARHGSTRIEVQCLSCGRLGSFGAEDDRVSGTPLVHLTRRFRCSACGSRAVKAKAIGTPLDLARRMRVRMRADDGR